MKASRLLMALFSVAMVMVFAGHALKTKKVVVISFVDEEMARQVKGYAKVYEGINAVFEKAGIVPEYHWVEMEGLDNEAKKAAAGEAALARAKAVNPDLLILLNDDCVKYVGLKTNDIPVVFAWVFGTPETLGLPKSNITGVFRRSYTVDIWSMAKRLLDVDTVALISKCTESMAGVKRYLTAGADQLAQASGVRYMDMFLVNTFEEWAEAVKNFPADFIYMADTSRVTKGVKVLSRAEISRWTADNATVPVIAAAEVDVEAGALFSIVTSERAIGENAAEVALKILNGTAPADIPYVTCARGKLVVNVATAQRMGLDIPHEILSTAEAIYE